VNLTDFTGCLAASTCKPAGTPAFEFLRWMAFWDSHESEVMKLRFIEQWGIPGDRFFPGVRPARSAGEYLTQRKSWRRI